MTDNWTRATALTLRQSTCQRARAPQTCRSLGCCGPCWKLPLPVGSAPGSTACWDPTGTREYGKIRGKRAEGVKKRAWVCPVSDSQRTVPRRWVCGIQNLLRMAVNQSGSPILPLIHEPWHRKRRMTDGTGSTPLLRKKLMQKHDKPIAAGCEQRPSRDG